MLRAGYYCEICGADLMNNTPVSLHHRLPRGMGGSSHPDRHSSSNLMAVCGTGTTGCHGVIESYRAQAYEHGWLVRRGQDPAEVEVLIWRQGWVRLTKDATYGPRRPA
jgi:hypothetical protein